MACFVVVVIVVIVIIGIIVIVVVIIVISLAALASGAPAESQRDVLYKLTERVLFRLGQKEFLLFGKANRSATLTLNSLGSRVTALAKKDRLVDSELRAPPLNF